MIWLWLSAALMLATAIGHSWLGEKRLIGPHLRAREGMMQSGFVRALTRYAFHVTSALMLATALVVVWPGVPDGPVVAVGAIWLALGLTSLIALRGKHVAWPLLTGAGVFALIGAAG